MIKKLLSVILVFGIINTAQSEEARNYTVELVVFENLNNQDRQSERWRSDAKLLLPSTSVELGINEQRFGFRSLPRTSFHLSKEAAALEDTQTYRILLHTAWRQPGLEMQASIPVVIRREIQLPASPANPAPAPKVLEGWIRIILSRYLHADFDLIYRDLHTLVPAADPAQLSLPEKSKTIPTQAQPVYRLKQTRKMRSKEVHYLDNPVLGALILITPVN